MKIQLIALTFALFSVGAHASPEAAMTLEEVGNFGGAQLFLPCRFGSCMIDTGGGGNMVPPGPDANSLAKTGEVSINTVIGRKQCDVLAPFDFEFAGVTVTKANFIRCAINTDEQAPMLGLPIFNGKAFALNFIAKTFQWLDGQVNLAQALYHIPNTTWIAVDVTLGGVPNKAMIDTGAPTTLVDLAYVNQHPEQFSAPLQGDLPQGAPAGMGFRNLLTPLLVNGLPISNSAVMVLDMKGSLGPNAPEITLGMNHLREFNWKLDLTAGRYEVSK